jgi:hypothetical protein
MFNMNFDINSFLFDNPESDGWLMNPGERAFFYYILQNFTIDTSIEIGRYKGGSTFPMADYSKKCISIDPIPLNSEKYTGIKNLTLIDDYSWNVLGKLLSENDNVNLILVDGDHETESVKKELDIIKHYIPKNYTIVLIHDTFYPQVREAMDSINWQEHPYIHFVDLDIIQGCRWELGCMCHSDPSTNDISGMGRNGIYHLGFGMIVILNGKRNFELEYYRSHQKIFDACKGRNPW